MNTYTFVYLCTFQLVSEKRKENRYWWIKNTFLSTTFSRHEFLKDLREELGWGGGRRLPRSAAWNYIIHGCPPSHTGSLRTNARMYLSWEMNILICVPLLLFFARKARINFNILFYSHSSPHGTQRICRFFFSWCRVCVCDGWLKMMGRNLFNKRLMATNAVVVRVVCAYRQLSCIPHI